MRMNERGRSYALFMNTLHKDSKNPATVIGDFIKRNTDDDIIVSVNSKSPALKIETVGGKPEEIKLSSDTITYRILATLYAANIMVTEYTSDVTMRIVDDDGSTIYAEFMGTRIRIGFSEMIG